MLTTVGEKLLIPLILALFIAVFGWFFGPHLTNAWQDRQHHFDTKSALADELSLASAELMSAVQTREFDAATETSDLYLKAYQAWDKESQVIDAKIATYFANGQDLAAGWREFADKMRLYHNLPDQRQAGPARQHTLAQLARYVGWLRILPILHTSPADRNDNVRYQNKWVALKEALIEKRDAIVAGLLHQRSAT
jgi:hypothetical protein